MRAKAIRVKFELKHVLEKMLFDYFQEIDQSKISQNQELVYPYLDFYWKEEVRKAFFIEHDGQHVGFVLINNWVLNKEYNADYSIAEFYIKSKYRRKGIGRKVVEEIFNKYNGKWEIRIQAKNKTAIKFWRNCTNKYTKENFQELKTEIDAETVLLHLFTT